MKKLVITLGIVLSVIFVFNVSNVSAAPAYYFAKILKVGASSAMPLAQIEEANGAWKKWCSFAGTTKNASLATALTALSTGKQVYIYVDPNDGTNPIVLGIYVIE